MTTFQTYPVQTPAQLSVHLKSLRKARGLTQAQLGQRIGIKQVRVAAIEKNPGAVSLDQLMRLLHALDARLLLEDTQRYPDYVSPPPIVIQSPSADW